MSLVPYISTNNITKLNKLIYSWAKLAHEKIGFPLKKHKKKTSKPGWEIRLETDKKSTKTDQNDKTKEKAKQEKITVQLEEIN